MELDTIFLHKDEISIQDNSDMPPGFYIPIHKKLLDNELNFNPNLAKEIFPEVAEEWRDELEVYTRSMYNEKKNQIYERFLNDELKVEQDGFDYTANPGNFRSHIVTDENGFARSLSIGASMKGSIGIDSSNPSKMVGSMIFS